MKYLTKKEKREYNKLRFTKNHPYESDFADGIYQTRRLEKEGPHLIKLMKENKDKQALQYYKKEM